MNADRLREFYDRAGFRTARTTSAHWFVPGKHIYRSFPAGRPVAPTADEVAELCRHSGVYGVEFVNATPIGVPSGLWMVRDPAYDQRSLQRQFRQHLERAFADESVQQIGFDELFRLGVTANLETLGRQRRRDRHFSDPALWRRLCDAGKQTLGAGVFASMRAGELSAYLVYFIVGDTCHGLFSKSCNQARRAGSNHALYFIYTKTMIRRENISTVTTGPQSIPPIAAIDRFKRHAGYNLEPYHFAVSLRPRVSALLLSDSAGALLRAGERRFRSSEMLRRALTLRYEVRETSRRSPDP